MNRPLVSIASLLPGNQQPLAGATDRAHVRVHRMEDDDEPGQKGNGMKKAKVTARQRILDALARGPKSAPEIAQMGVNDAAVVLSAMHKNSLISRSGSVGSYVYRLSSEAPKAARIKTQSIPGAARPNPPAPPPRVSPSFPFAQIEAPRPLNLEVTAAPARAILKADGGCLIVRGATITCEISAADLELVRQL